MIRRMRPPASIDLDLDRAQRAVYLQQLWSFVSALPPASNSLKAHVLWHLLDAGRQRDASVDPSLFTTYLQLPRNAGYLPRALLEHVRRDDIAEVGRDFRDVTGLGPAGDDEALVRDLIQRSLANANRYAQWLDRAWFDAEVATAQLLAGDPATADRATVTLGPARAQALRDKVELAWCPHNPTRFGIDEPIALDLDVKNVTELVVKVFRDRSARVLPASSSRGRDRCRSRRARGVERARASVQRGSRAPRAPPHRPPDVLARRQLRHRSDRQRHVEPRRRPQGATAPCLARRCRGRLHRNDRRRRRPARPDARAWIGDREYVPDERGAITCRSRRTPADADAPQSPATSPPWSDWEPLRESATSSAFALADRESMTADDPREP